MANVLLLHQYNVPFKKKKVAFKYMQKFYTHFGEMVIKMSYVPSSVPILDFCSCRWVTVH